MQKSLIIILFLIFNLTFGQEKFDPTENMISDFKVKLNGKGVSDFFVIKRITYGTAYIYDFDDPNSCNPNGIYFTMYAFWKNEEGSFVKKFDNCGGFNSIKLADSKPIDFYQKNIEEIKLSEVKPYQTTSDSIANGLIYRGVKTLNHQPQRYFWFFNKSGVFQNDFDKFKLTTEKEEPNLNYKFNNNLPIVKLNAICEEIINNLNKANEFDYS
jgi:hypothetical protein